jgi:plastocyanin
MSRPEPDPTTRRSFLGLAAIGVLGLTVAGCGSDDGGAATTAPATSAADPTGPATSTTAAAAAASDGDTVAVSMKDIQFVPEVVTVKVGQTVVWTNTDAVQHDVRALKGAKFQSALFGQGGTYEFKPKKAGTVEYDCSVHPGMVGSLKVVA